MDSTRLRRDTVIIARVVTTLLYVWVIVSEVLLAIAFVLRLFGADPTAGFTEFVYRSVERAMTPFRGIFEPIPLGTGRNEVEAVIDTSILFAMLVYALLLLAIGALVDWLKWRLVRLDERRTLEREQARRDAEVQQRMFERQPEPRVVVTASPEPDVWSATAGPGGPDPSAT